MTWFVSKPWCRNPCILTTSTGRHYKSISTVSPNPKDQRRKIFFIYRTLMAPDCLASCSSNSRTEHWGLKSTGAKGTAHCQPEPFNRARLSVDRKSEIKLPEFSPGSVTRMINKRNEKFQTVMNDHLHTCRAKVWSQSPFTSICSLTSRTWMNGWSWEESHNNTFPSTISLNPCRRVRI